MISSKVTNNLIPFHRWANENKWAIKKKKKRRGHKRKRKREKKKKRKKKEIGPSRCFSDEGVGFKKEVIVKTECYHETRSIKMMQRPFDFAIRKKLVMAKFSQK